MRGISPAVTLNGITGFGRLRAMQNAAIAEQAHE
jgi:hypothetical protein